VKWLQHELEHLTGEQISGEALGRAMLHEEEKRSLLRAFNDKRRLDLPPVSETDMLQLVSATNLLTAPDCAALLRHNLIATGVRVGTEGADSDQPPHASVNSSRHPTIPSSLHPSRRPRLMLAGSIVAEHDLELVQMIEERATIVTDLMCNGVRTFVDPLDVPVTSDTDALREALADYYFDQPGCIQRRPNRGYYGLARRLAKEFRVEGVILKTLLFCDAHNYEAVRFAKEVDLPLLHLDTDYGERNREQIRTRVEAFLETL
jgi:benzoyl-CoA reductase/2-hydroxyglutaryl-CoA dehydratase subunit BcrC/BadD/HgdB